jgi:hypothetical protein
MLKTDLVNGFQRLSSLDEDAIGCANSSADHHSGGCGKSQSAGTSNAQYGDAKLEGMLKNGFVLVLATLLRNKSSYNHCIHWKIEMNERKVINKNTDSMQLDEEQVADGEASEGHWDSRILGKIQGEIGKMDTGLAKYIGQFKNSLRPTCLH